MSVSNENENVELMPWKINFPRAKNIPGRHIVPLKYNRLVNLQET